MTNVEIEDVLSSIRRLVSEETALLKARKPDRLMLTPAFRVAEAARAAPPKDREATTEAEAVSLEERIAALEAQIGSEDFEPDGSEDQAQHIPRSVFHSVREDFRVEAASPEAVAEATDLQAEAAAAEPQGAEAIPEAADTGAETTAEAASPAVETLTGAREPVAQAGSANAAVVEADELESPAPARRIATPMQIEEALIDEAALREIVGSLVREELRGELGERITRNVRRLIRREIHRALTLQGMEEDDED